MMDVDTFEANLLEGLNLDDNDVLVTQGLVSGGVAIRSIKKVDANAYLVTFEHHAPGINPVWIYQDGELVGITTTSNFSFHIAPNATLNFAILDRPAPWDINHYPATLDVQWEKSEDTLLYELKRTEDAVEQETQEVFSQGLQYREFQYDGLSDGTVQIIEITPVGPSGNKPGSGNSVTRTIVTYSDDAPAVFSYATNNLTVT